MAVKVNHGQRFKLLTKYQGMCLLDKNPDGEDGESDLDDEADWEDRLITGIVWQRREGWRAETKLRNTAQAQQSTLPYPLHNGTIFKLIRASSHNTKPMQSAMDAGSSDEETSEADEDEQDGGLGGEDSK